MVRMALFSTVEDVGSVRTSFWQLTVVSESMARIVAGIRILFIVLVYSCLCVTYYILSAIVKKITSN